MRIKPSVVSNLMFLFYKSIACAVYLRDHYLQLYSHYLHESLEKYKINRR